MHHHESYCRTECYMDKRSSRRELSFAGSGSTSICSHSQCGHSYLSPPAEWKNKYAHIYMCCLQVFPWCLVCCQRRHDVTRALANPSYIYTPGWRKNTSKGSTKSSDCCVVNCQPCSQAPPHLFGIATYISVQIQMCLNYKTQEQLGIRFRVQEMTQQSTPTGTVGLMQQKFKF